MPLLILSNKIQNSEFSKGILTEKADSEASVKSSLRDAARSLLPRSRYGIATYEQVRALLRESC